MPGKSSWPFLDGSGGHQDAHFVFTEEFDSLQLHHLFSYALALLRQDLVYG